MRVSYWAGEILCSVLWLLQSIRLNSHTICVNIKLQGMRCLLFSAQSSCLLSWKEFNILQLWNLRWIPFSMQPCAGWGTSWRFLPRSLTWTRGEVTVAWHLLCPQPWRLSYLRLESSSSTLYFVQQKVRTGTPLQNTNLVHNWVNEGESHVLPVVAL